jgi:hypothetical protein
VVVEETRWRPSWRRSRSSACGASARRPRRACGSYGLRDARRSREGARPRARAPPRHVGHAGARARARATTRAAWTPSARLARSAPRRRTSTTSRSQTTSRARSSDTRARSRSGCIKEGLHARGVVVKLKYSDFSLRSRRVLLPEPVARHRLDSPCGGEASRGVPPVLAWHSSHGDCGHASLRRRRGADAVPRCGAEEAREG